MAEEKNQTTWYWSGLDGITAGISWRQFGWMNFDIDDLDRDLTGGKNRKKFFEKLDVAKGRNVVLAGIQHTTNIQKVSSGGLGRIVHGKGGVDGLITDDPNLILAVTAADCFPIYFYAEEKRVVAIAHAGWRGVLENIAAKMVDQLKADYAIDAGDLQVLIGPGIRSCHFEVGEGVENLFRKEYDNQIKRTQNGTFIDLPGVVKRQLLEAGVIEAAIEDCEECTYEMEERYFSFRRDKPDKPQSMVAFIMLDDE